jgi:hypothetical protein
MLCCEAAPSLFQGTYNICLFNKMIGAIIILNDYKSRLIKSIYKFLMLFYTGGPLMKDTSRIVYLPDDNDQQAHTNHNHVVPTQTRNTMEIKPMPSQAKHYSPPWQIFRDELAYSIGADPQVEVSPVIGNNNNYFVTITASDTTKAQALATVLPQEKSFNTSTNDKIIIQVFDKENQIYEPVIPPVSTDVWGAAAILNTALFENPFFEALTVERLESGLEIYAIIKNQVISFPNNGPGEACIDYTNVAANVFSHVLVNKISTYPVYYANYSNPTHQ